MTFCAAAEVQFRVWLRDGEVERVETWCHDFVPLTAGRRSGDEWAAEHLQSVNWFADCNLDPAKDWQILGRGRLVGETDYWGDYDEQLDLDEYEAVEVPPGWWGDSDPPAATEGGT